MIVQFEYTETWDYRTGKPCQKWSHKNVKEYEINAFFEFVFVPNEKPCSKDDCKGGECVKINKICRAVQKNQFCTNKADKNDIFKKSRQRPENEKCGNHKNRVEEKRRMKNVLKKRGSKKIAHTAVDMQLDDKL